MPRRSGSRSPVRSPPRGPMTRSSPSRRPSGSPRPAAPAQTQSKSMTPAATPTSPAHPPAGNMAPAASAGTGMMGNIASVAAGSVLGHGISNAIWGSPSAQAQQAEVAADQPQSAFQNANDSGNYSQERIEEVCTPYRMNFLQCIQDNRQSITECQRQFDLYNSCKEGLQSSTRDL